MASEQSMASPAMGHEMNGVGHLYMQTNEIRNCVIHYHRSADGDDHRGGALLHRRRRVWRV